VTNFYILKAVNKFYYLFYSPEAQDLLS